MNQFQLPYGAPPLGGQMHMPPPPQQPPPPDSDGPKPKKQRVSRACDRCHTRACKCERRLDGLPGCQACLVYGVQCTFARPQKRRGMKPKEEASLPRVGESDAKLLLDLGHGSQLGAELNDVDGDAFVRGDLEKVRKLAMANEGQIQGLLDAYVELLYPVYPIFHIPTLKRRVKGGDHLSDLGFLAEVMSICAVSAVKIMVMAIPGPWMTSHLGGLTSDTFFSAAEALTPQSLGDLSNLGGMRTCAMLALYGLHVDKLGILHRYLGTYHSIVAIGSFHDERNWPGDIGIVEVEMRRRLFWSMYSLEVYIATIFGNLIRVQADRINVSDPSEVNDEFFSDQGYNPPGSLAPYFTTTAIMDPLCWIHGWNFNIDLYRILENCVSKAPSRRPASANRRANLLTPPNPNYENDTLSSFIPSYDILSSQFKNYTQSAAVSENGHVFPSKPELQAASINTTVQLIRMVLFNSRLPTSSAEQQAIASNLIESFIRIPTLSLKIIDSPQFFPLMGVLGILKSATQNGPLSENRCKHIGHDLAALAEILHSTGRALASIFAESINHQIQNLNLYIENPHNQIPAPAQQQQHISSPSGGSSGGVDDDGNGNGNLDPELSNTNTNGDAVTNTTAIQTTVPQVVGGKKKYDLLVSGGAVSASSRDMELELKGSEDIWFRLPEEVFEGGWEWGVDVGRGFGRA